MASPLPLLYAASEASRHCCMCSDPTRAVRWWAMTYAMGRPPVAVPFCAGHHPGRDDGVVAGPMGPDEVVAWEVLRS